MLKIRLQRVGRKNDPSFRVIVAESRRDSQSGKFVETLGAYNARRGRSEFRADRVKHWLAVGAKTSGTVHNLLVDQKIISGKKINVLPKRKKTGEEAKPAEAAKAAEPAVPVVDEKAA